MSAKSKKDEPKRTTSHTLKLDDEQMEKVNAYCDHHLWEWFDVQYSRFAFKNKAKQTTVVGYKSGKLVISGKGTEDFVRDYIEAEVTGEPRLGYEEVHNPEYYEAHAGMDEAGKGDVFGPVVAATVIAEPDMIRKWVAAGIKDSKRSTDSAILAQEKIITGTRGVVIKTAYCSMARYNELMAKPAANLNKLLAWLHAKALEGALNVKRVPWGMLDQFSKKPLVNQYFKDKEFNLKMETKAERDPVVAAASIVARATFLRELKKLEEEAGTTLPKGASAAVKKTGKDIVARLGPDVLPRFAKMHFRTCYEILGLPVPEKKAWKR